MPKLPSYYPMQAAFHEAFRADLKVLMRALPLCQGDRVLDVACGDGTYSRWLAERVGGQGHVTGVDISEPFLSLAKRMTHAFPYRQAITFLKADLTKHTIPADSFDVVWCAQSLYSFPEPLQVIQAMKRVTRPGGIVAVLEEDCLHQMLLPWPIDLELAVRLAEHRAFRREEDASQKYYAARQLRALFLKAGMHPQEKITAAWQREFPLAEKESVFLKEYGKNLRQHVWPFLNTRTRQQWKNEMSPTSPCYLPKQPAFAMTWLEQIVWAKKKSK